MVDGRCNCLVMEAVDFYCETENLVNCFGFSVSFGWTFNLTGAERDTMQTENRLYIRYLLVLVLLFTYFHFIAFPSITLYFRFTMHLTGRLVPLSDAARTKLSIVA